MYRMKLGGCKTGEAKVTGAYRLPCQYIIHTVGSVWHNGKKGEADLLKNCYRNTMAAAKELGIQRVAFPSIFTGSFHFPLELAASIAIHTVSEYVKENPSSFDLIEWVLFDKQTWELKQKVIKRA